MTHFLNRWLFDFLLVKADCYPFATSCHEHQVAHLRLRERYGYYFLHFDIADKLIPLQVFRNALCYLFLSDFNQFVKLVSKHTQVVNTKDHLVICFIGLTCYYLVRIEYVALIVDVQADYT